MYQGRPVLKGWRAAAVPEIWRKIKYGIKVFIRTYVTYILSLKECERDHFKFKYSRRTPSAAESELTVPYPDVVFGSAQLGSGPG
jgi:hypothetical protein